ncbi:MAG: hypothetical protein ABIP85_19010 [Chthoniobacteraceae bacterium]
MLPQQFKPALNELARGGIYIGTSSWKYPGWCGQVCDEQRYLTLSKFSMAKFERHSEGGFLLEQHSAMALRLVARRSALMRSSSLSMDSSPTRRLASSRRSWSGSVSGREERPA